MDLCSITSRNHKRKSRSPTQPICPKDPKSEDKKTKVDHSRVPLPDEIFDNSENNNVCYKRLNILGKGGFARVYRVQESNSKRDFALKVFIKDELRKEKLPDRALKKVWHEISIHKRMSHENILQFYSHFENKLNIHLLLEFCPNKSLFDVSKEKKKLPEEEVRNYVHQILEGVDHILSLEVFHRDLKLGNMFLSSDMSVKIGDFGLAATFAENKPGSLCGTPNYIAPEVLAKKGHSEASEVWSIGCMVYALLEGVPPFETDSVKDTYERIRRGYYPVPSVISDDAKSFLGTMLDMDPRRRGFIRNGVNFSSRSLHLKNHPFMKSYPSDKSLVELKTQPKGTREEAIKLNSSGLTLFQDYSTLPTRNGGIKDTNNDIISILLEKLRGGLAIESHSIIDYEISPIFINMWVDFTNKYGFGFKTSEGSVGLKFNDKSLICRLKNNTIHYKEDGGRTSKIFNYRELSENSSLTGRLDGLEFVRKYMEETLDDVSRRLIHKSGISNGRKRVTSETLSLSHWMVNESFAILQLGVNTVQLNCRETHVKVVVWEDEKDLWLSEIQGGYFSTYRWDFLPISLRLIMLKAKGHLEKFMCCRH